MDNIKSWTLCYSTFQKLSFFFMDLKSCICSAISCIHTDIHTSGRLSCCAFYCVCLIFHHCCSRYICVFKQSRARGCLERNNSCISSDDTWSISSPCPLPFLTQHYNKIYLYIYTHISAGVCYPHFQCGWQISLTMMLIAI